MSRKKTELTPEAPDLTPKEIVMRVLGCGESAADGVLRRMGAAADELPAKYASKEARDWVTTHNVTPPKAEAPKDSGASVHGDAAGDASQE